MKLIINIIVIYLSMGLIAHAQIKLQNPSLDGGNGLNNVPQYWNICVETPDVLPVSGYFIQPPYHGVSYIGLGVWNSLLVIPSNRLFESVGIFLNCSLIQGEEHFFNIYLTQLKKNSVTNGDSIQLKIFGGGLACDTAQLLWCSPIIKNTTWQRYRVNFIPKQNYQFLTFGSFNASAIPSDTFHSNIAYLGLDSISDIILPHYKIVKATITQDTATHCFQLSSAAAYGGLNFQWSSIPSGFSSSAQNPGLLCPVVNTSYIVSFTTPCGSIVYDTVFADMHTGVNEVDRNKLLIYPNPASTELRIMIDDIRLNAIDLTDVFGRFMLRNEASNQQINNSSTQQFKLDVSSLSNGIYFIKAFETNGNIYFGKFMKE